jgi:hypothetical protein
VVERKLVSLTNISRTRLLSFKPSSLDNARLASVLNIANPSRPVSVNEHRRHIAAVAMRGGAGVVALLTAYVVFTVWQRLELNQKRRISERMKSVAPELSNFKTGPLWLQRPEKNTFLTDLCSSDPAGPLLVTGPSGCGKSMLLRKALNGRPSVSYINLRSSPVVSADNLTVSFITRCGYLLPPNELLGRAVFKTEQRQYDVAEVDRGLRLIKDVLLAEKARGWTALAPDNTFRVIPPLICIDELNYELNDPVFWRLLDWLLHVSDNRLAHVILCTSLDTAELLDRYPGFRARRQRVFIDYPRDYTVSYYLRETVNPFLQSQLGAISRPRITPAAPLADASASQPPAASFTAPVILSSTAALLGTPPTPSQPSRPRSWLEWWRGAINSIIGKESTQITINGEARRLESSASVASLPSPTSAGVGPAAILAASSVKRTETISSSACEPLVSQSDALSMPGTSTTEKLFEKPAPTDAANRASMVMAPSILQKDQLPSDTLKREIVGKVRDLAISQQSLPAKLDSPEDVTALDAATAMPVAAAKAALRAQQQAAAAALAHLKQQKETINVSSQPVGVDLFAADSPPLINDTTQPGTVENSEIQVASSTPDVTNAASSSRMSPSLPPNVEIVVRSPIGTGTLSSTEPTSHTHKASSKDDDTIAGENISPNLISQNPGPHILIQRKPQTDPGHSAVAPVSKSLFDQQPSKLPEYSSDDFVSVDTAAMSGDGLYGDAEDLYLLEQDEIDSIVETVGGHLQDLLIVVTAVTRGQSWGEALERLVADSAKAVEHMLDDILSADQPTNGAPTPLPSGGRSHVSSLSRDHVQPLHDYQTNPSPSRLAAYGRYVRSWTLLCALSKSKFVSKRELAARVFPACPHELDFLEATGLITTINVKAAAKIESTTGFLELQKNHPGIFVTAATPRLRVAFRVVTRDLRLQLQMTRILAALRVASLRHTESELVKKLPEVVAERSYAFQLLQSLLTRDTALRSSLVAREVKITPVHESSSPSSGILTDAEVPGAASMLDSADLLGLEVARGRMQALEKEVADLRNALTAVRAEIEIAMHEASEPSAAAVVMASEWGPVMGSAGDAGPQSSASGRDGNTQSSTTFDDVQHTLVSASESAEIGNMKNVGGSAEDKASADSWSHSLLSPRYISVGGPGQLGFDSAALLSHQTEMLKQTWTNPPAPPLPLQPTYYSVPALPTSTSAFGNDTAAAARSPLSPRRRWNQRRASDAGDENSTSRIGSARSAFGGMGVGVERDDDVVSPYANPPPKRNTSSSDDKDPSSSWHGNTSASYRWWL